MREHPLLMQGPLVRATLAGLKTQTRRPVQPWLGRNPPLWSRLLDQDGRPDFDWGELLYYGQDEDSLRHGFGFDDSGHGCPENDAWLTSPIGQVGDRLWVRETWTAAMHDPKGPADCLYRADDNRGVEDLAEAKWTPSIHMPRWACRLVLPLVSVRVERVQDITEEDARAEGVELISSGPDWECWMGYGPHGSCKSARESFRSLWVSIYGQESWDANPWAWVAEWEDIEVSR